MLGRNRNDKQFDIDHNKSGKSIFILGQAQAQLARIKDKRNMCHSVSEGSGIKFLIDQDFVGQ